MVIIIILLFQILLKSKAINGNRMAKSLIINEIKDVWRFVRLRNFSPESSFDLLRQCESNKLSVNYHIPRNHGYQSSSVKKVIGTGIDCFLSASQTVFNGTASNCLPWAKLVFAPDKGLRVNATIATITRFHFLPLFSFNPCRITHLEVNRPAHQLEQSFFEKFHRNRRFDDTIERYSRLVYQTLEGHMLDGEESLYVNYHKNDTVTFQMRSFARVSSRLLMPFEWSIRSLQHRFLVDHVKSFPSSLDSPIVISTDTFD